jgi:dolichol-phosphate mannosyltransferase
VEVSVILPTFNEKENIFLLITDIKKKLKNTSLEIIVIDDNSPDGTGLICKNNFIKDQSVKIIVNKKKIGFSESIYKGILNSTKKNIIVMDTDLTHDPILIPKMLRLIDEYDIIIGSRYCAGGYMQDQIHSHLSFFYNILLRLILKSQVQDNLGGYFCIKRNTLMKLPNKKIFYGYGEYFFRLLFFAFKKNLTILEIPATYKNRVRGRSKSSFIYMSCKYFIEAIKLRLS